MQLTMPFALQPSYHAVDFIRGEANGAALDWIERWPDWPYSIMLLHGPAGSGKTHLAHIFAGRTGGSFIAPERLGLVPADQILTGNHCWVLDGLDDVANESALAQLINHARARGDYLLITAREPDEALLTGVLAKSFADLQLRIAPEVLHYAINQLERSFAAIQRFAVAMDQLSLTRGRAITIPLVRGVLQSSLWQEEA